MATKTRLPPPATLPRHLFVRGWTATWNGRPGVVWEAAQTDSVISRLGQRLVIHRWSDDMSGHVSVVHGDGRTDKFKVYARVEVSPGGDFQVAVDQALYESGVRILNDTPIN